MKKLLSIILSALCLFMGVCFVGCSEDGNVIIPTGNYYSDEEGVYLAIESIEDADEYIKLNVKWHNETDNEIIYYPSYEIYERKNNEWINLRTTDVNYPYIEYSLAPYSSATETYTTEYFDVSKEGVYILSVTCSVEGRDKSCGVWAEFEIKAFEKLERHRMSAQLDDWLYEELENYYKEGEKIVVKIEIDYDMVFSLYINGHKLQQDPHESGRDYWQYTFTMPGKDVALTYKVSDGMTLCTLIEQVETSDPVTYRFASEQEHFGCLLINGTEVKEYALSFHGMYFVELTDRTIEDPEVTYRLVVSGDLNFHIRLYSETMFVLEGKLYEISTPSNDFSVIFEDYPL